MILRTENLVLGSFLLSIENNYRYASLSFLIKIELSMLYFFDEKTIIDS